MRKTSQEFRRENVRKLFDKVLSNEKIILSPLSINIFESLDDDFTNVDLSFAEKTLDVENIITLKQTKAKGFIDGLFLSLHEKYSKQYNSLEKIKLVDIMVNPIMKASTTRGSDAKTSVILRVEVKTHGISEFEHESRSMIYSSFVSSLAAFQFYINCQKTFEKIKLIVTDAENRNRGDIVQGCLSDLSVLTSVNTYG